MRSDAGLYETAPAPEDHGPELSEVYVDDEPEPNRRSWRGPLLLTAGACGFFLAGAFASFGALASARRLLVIENLRPAPSGAIVVLGGAGDSRARRAAELYHEGLAPLVIVSSDCARNVPLLTSLGVPGDAILTECASTSTKENAEFTVPLLIHRGIHRVIVVTSWYHTRRALASFAHFAPELTVVSVPSQEGLGFYSGVADELRYVGMEYFKLLGYAVGHGIWPWEAERVTTAYKKRQRTASR